MQRLISLIVIFGMMISALALPTSVYGDTVLPNRFLSIGSQGADVIKVQETLNQLGYSVKVDGFYGLKTQQALLLFQQKYAALKADGVYGPGTGFYLAMALTENQTNGSGQAPSEENVNDNLKEDMSLTYDAEKHGLINMIAQSFIDINRDQLKKTGEDIPVLNTWNTMLPEDLTENLQYDKYPMAYDYFLVTTATLNIRELPTTESKILKKAAYFDKINLIQEVTGQYVARYSSDRWIQVFWPENGQVKSGFVLSKLGEARSFRFDSMMKEIKNLQKTVSESKLGYISNYKNINGYPSAYKGGDKDEYGVDRSQSAPGYIDINQESFRYFPDGMIVSILAEVEGYYRVSTPSFEGEYLVPKKYISFRNVPKQLKKVVVVDDLNQNEGVFELSDGKWQLVSYSYATTGIENQYSYETPKGHFMAIEKKRYFLYLEDGTTRISGFAPYAIRFSGGGYIHGVPIDFKPEQDQFTVSPTDPVNYEEYLFTIGTTPRSHKCVRNFTSHAKFLYDWAEIGSTMVIVIH